MTLQTMLLRWSARRSDRKRDAAIALPHGVTECRNIAYHAYDKWSLLDVYYPDGTQSPLPTIVSIHGGGYVYGTKEEYRRYGMDLARRGFAVINFNYRLAPKWKFPTPLYDTNAVMDWICKNAERYHLDPERVILVGDSAGAQIASQYAAIVTNPEYASLFALKVPHITIRCQALNCGLYDFDAQGFFRPTGIARDYLGRNPSPEDPRFHVIEAITTHYPPTYLTTACHDFLRGQAEPMFDHLKSRGIPAAWKCYGCEENTAVGHVFHLNLALKEATLCNDETVAFFQTYV